MGLCRYLLKRTVNTAVLVVFVVVINFLIFDLLPGTQGIIAAFLGNPRRDPAAIDRILTKWGLCQGLDEFGECIPTDLWTRFSRYFVNILTFQFGDSMQTGKPVLDDVIGSGRLANTLTLLGTATVISLIVGTVLGVLVAARRGSLFDGGWVVTSLITFSLPTFWMGLIFIMVFAQQLNWFPSGGVTPPIWILGKPPFLEQILVRMQHLFLPALTLTLFFYGGNLLLTRATTLEALSEDCITTARAKGLPERTVLFKHALKNASLPLVTNAALSFAGLLGGAVITETVFNWDGLGYWLFSSIGWKDLTVMQAMFYLIALTTIAANFISDIIYGILDPRISYQ